MKNKLSILFLLALFVSLKTTLVEANEIPFAVQPEFNEKQNKAVADYYDMTLTPTEELAITLKITNKSDTESQHVLSLENAFTNQNGLIDFKSKGMNNGLIPDFTTVASTSSKVTVAARSTLDHVVQIEMPQTPYAGVLLGGIRVKELSDKQTKAQVTNTDSYLIPIKLRQGKQEYNDLLEMDGLTIDKTLPFQTSLLLRLNNPQPDVLRELKLSVKIKSQKTSEETWQELTDKELQMAPLTMTTYPIALKDPLKAGTYLVKIKGETATFSQEWEEELVLDRATAKKIKKELDTNKTNSYEWLIILLLVIICGQAFIFLNYRRQKKNEKS